MADTINEVIQWNMVCDGQTFFSVGEYSLRSESNLYGVLRVVSTPTEIK